MKKSYDMRWSDTSEKDLITIVQYIADDNPHQTNEIFKRIKERTSALRFFPDRGRIVP
jgi:plasmid stabilization system protein ParE